MEKQESAISSTDKTLKDSNPSNSNGKKIAVRSSLNKAGKLKQSAAQNQKESFEEKKNVQYDKKYRKKKSGIYQQTILERAKEVLKDNLFEIAELTKQGIWDKLSPEEQKSIKKFIVNIRQKEKKGQCGVSESLEAKLIITQDQQNIISNVQVSRNELISKELCASQTFENQVAVMLKQNRQNHLAIFDFLKSLQQEPFEKFFEVLIEVIQAIENCTQQVRLLIGLFGIYNGQKLIPTSDLCVQALKYLAKEDGVTSQQVIGFLKFTFVTNGDLHNAELSDLIQFDKRHKQCFVGFKQWLQWTFHLPPDLTLVLPNSCYILGLPFAKRLQSESAILTEHIPSDFLALFIQVLVFSFEKDEQPFLDFLDCAKNGFLGLIEKIKTTQLLNLFSALLDQVRLHNRQWYLNIRNSRRLIEGALLLVKESKVRIFDNEVCQNLLSELTNVDQYLAAPSIIQSYKKETNDEQFRVFIQLNQKNRGAQNFLQGFDFCESLPQRVLNNFFALKITPHFIQELAMKIIYRQYNTHSFLNIAPGLGKTKLILAAAINLVQSTQFPVFILNSSKTLCDRDFQEATFSLEELKIPCASVISQKAKITFVTTQDFIDNKDDLPEKYHTLLDEYQNIFFVGYKFFDFVEILQFNETFIGFSGSPISFIQKKLLEHSFSKQALVLQLTPHTELGDQETVICKTQSQLIKELSDLADRFRWDTPQVFILDFQTAATLIKGRKKRPFISLIDKEPQTVNNILSELFNKPNDDGSYGTYIINEEMGTGTDFKTSADIENKGGLVLVFGIKPTNTSTFEQLSCRVGRIFNKSRRFYVIHDATYVGSSEHYLKYQLKILKQKECEEARALLSKLKPDINNENYDKQTDSMVIDETNEDIEIKDETADQFSLSRISKNGGGRFENEKLSGVHDDNDESFDGKELEIECKRSKKRLKCGKDGKKSLGGGKRRVRKNQSKVNQQQNKFQQHHNEENEECKFCGDPDIELHTCKMAQKHVGTTQITTPATNINTINIKNADATSKMKLDKTLDSEIFVKYDCHLQLEEQISADQSMIIEKGSKVSLQHDFILGNADISISKAAIQLQKRHREKKSAYLLEQDVKKLLETQEKVHEEGSKENKKDHIMIIQKKETIRCSSRKVLNLVDQAYFKNYGNKEIHEEMLNDKVRCETYKKAIEASVKGKIVLDVGAGTGFLSVIAAKAGATHVYTVEYSEMAEYAKQFINDNGCTNNITLIKKRMEDVNILDIPKVDVVISEWMGYFLLFENMLPSVIDARKRFLKENGLMLPCEGKIYIAGVEWIGTEMNGVIMQPDKKSFNEAQVMLCNQDRVISNQCIISDFDLQESSNPLENFGDQSFTFQLTRDATVNAFVGWFDVALTKQINLSTAPSQPATHWKQVMFFLKKEIQAKAGEIIEGVFKMKAGSQNHRSLSIDLSYKLSSSKSVLKQSFVLEQ